MFAVRQSANWQYNMEMKFFADYKNDAPNQVTCFLSQLAYNSEILSKFVDDKPRSVAR